jgi:hypothetical protein
MVAQTHINNIMKTKIKNFESLVQDLLSTLKKWKQLNYDLNVHIECPIHMAEHTCQRCPFNSKKIDGSTDTFSGDRCCNAFFEGIDSVSLTQDNSKAFDKFIGIVKKEL